MKSHILCDSPYMKCPEQANPKRQKVCQGLGAGMGRMGHPRPGGASGTASRGGIHPGGEESPARAPSVGRQEPNKDSQPNLGRLWCGALGRRLWPLLWLLIY